MLCPRRSELSGPSPFKLPEEDTWGEDKTCSYCGSMAPDVFMEKAISGVELGPTDKNYKVYVGKDDHHKFYFQHLSEEQQKEFFCLLATGKLNVGYPGYFYVRPFFIVRRDS